MMNETVKCVWTHPGEPTTETNAGSINISYFDKKHDQGKLRWDLLSLKQIEPIVAVLTFGAKKYSPNSWKKVPSGEKRYYAALMRHLTDYKAGKKFDEESMLPVIWHAFCDLYFLIYFEQRRNRNTQTKRRIIMATCKANKPAKKVAKKK